MDEQRGDGHVHERRSLAKHLRDKPSQTERLLAVQQRIDPLQQNRIAIPRTFELLASQENEVRPIGQRIEQGDLLNDLAVFIFGLPHSDHDDIVAIFQSGHGGERLSHSPKLLPPELDLSRLEASVLGDAQQSTQAGLFVLQ